MRAGMNVRVAVSGEEEVQVVNQFLAQMKVTRNRQTRTRSKHVKDCSSGTKSSLETMVP